MFLNIVPPIFIIKVRSKFRTFVLFRGRETCYVFFEKIIKKTKTYLFCNGKETEHRRHEQFSSKCLINLTINDIKKCYPFILL